MKRSMAVALMAMATSLTGCGNGDATAEQPVAPEAAAEAADSVVPAASDALVPAAMTSGVPTFAVPYPDSQSAGSQTVATGPDGPGGILTFTTEADPDTVVAWYRQRAEAAGLSSVMAMNQGKARAYGATAADNAGTNLRVVADPVDDGSTSVQLTWSVGR
jgi:hypothetical protein